MKAAYVVMKEGVPLRVCADWKEVCLFMSERRIDCETQRERDVSIWYPKFGTNYTVFYTPIYGR